MMHCSFFSGLSPLPFFPYKVAHLRLLIKNQCRQKRKNAKKVKLEETQAKQIRSKSKKAKVKAECTVHQCQHMSYRKLIYFTSFISAPRA